MRTTKWHYTLFSYAIKRESSWDISDIQTTNNVVYTLAENFIFNFRIYKIFSYLLSFGNFSSIEFTFAIAYFSHTKHFQRSVFQ